MSDSYPIALMGFFLGPYLKDILCRNRARGMRDGKVSSESDTPAT